MKWVRAVLFVFGVLIISCSEQTATKDKIDYTIYVDPFIGTDGPGNTYPGAVAPFGMVQLSPDNGLPGWDRIAGYFYPDSTIAGFSHTHLTGTGAGDMYDLLLFPMNSRFEDDLWPKQEDYRPYSKFSHEKEEASPGYYKVLLESSGITAELTTTKRVGVHRYTFPKDENSKIILDLGYKLNWDDPTETFIEVEDSVTISGYRRSTGWAKDQHVYFVAKFSKPFIAEDLYVNNDLVEEQRVKEKKTKIDLHFTTSENEEVLVKVGISSASIEGAKLNLTEELPDWDFNKVADEAKHEWNKYLSKIKISGTDYQKRVFYSNLYHTALTPSLHSDVNGEFKAADGTFQEADNYTRYHTFSLWDTYRAAHPLYTILVPEMVPDFINSFLGHYDETALLPVWELAGNETNMMIGYHAIPVIVDAYFKGIPFKYEKAYEACKASAMEEGRSIDEYKQYGYVPSDGKEHGHWSVSKTMEYAYGDWCVAQFAKALGKDEDYKYFSKRADNWKNHWDEASTFFRPKHKNGDFVSPFIPKVYTELFCESNAWQYFWHIQHDIPGLIEITGKDRFVAKLDSMFSYYPEPEDELPIFSTGMIGQYAHGNEPCHHVAFIYNMVDKPYKTQELVREIIETQYSDKPDGFCGNEDCGQMSAWLIFSSLGMYPVNPADGVYHLTTPWFEEATIDVGEGKTLRILCENFSSENKYIKEIWLNGEKVDGYTISYKQLMSGRELKFILGPQTD